MQNEPRQDPTELPQRPTALGEDSVVAQGVPRSQGLYRAEQIQNRATTRGQDRGEEQNNETFARGTCESSDQGMQERTSNTENAAWERLGPAQPAAFGLAFGLTLPPTQAFALSPRPGLPLPLSRRYSGHWSLRAVETWWRNDPTIPPQRLHFVYGNCSRKGSKKGQKSN